MFKKHIGIALSLFVVLTIKQLIINKEIDWIDNIGISVLVFLIYNLWEWTKKPYEWNKDKK